MKKRTRSMRIMNLHIPYHIIMIIWSLIAMAPVWLLLINTLKPKKEIYTNPFGLPATSKIRLLLWSFRWR